MNWKTVLVSPEQIADLGETLPTWIREATSAESHAFKEAHPMVNSIDHNGRPYWAYCVDINSAPQPIANACRNALRIFRF